jgi:hypothetical protein
MNSRLALITPHLDDLWVTQIARNVTLPRALLLGARRRERG